MIINSAESMIGMIRDFGIIPFFRCGIPGWSIEENTDPGYWFYTSDELGPWDWKIDTVREGDIAYGKFISRKAAFATVEWYHHLMNWRRANPKYRVALGEKYPAKTTGEKLLKYLSPTALRAIKENGSLEMTDLRRICGEQVTDFQIRALGRDYKPLLRPSVKKNVMDTVMQFLDMGTWTVTGDFRRVYRGPNLEYHGWQRSSITTPDALFGFSVESHQSENPFWAKFIDNGPAEISADCTPEESRELLISHILGFFPTERKVLEKII